MQEDTKVNNLRGSEWHKWDLHIHTASSYDSPYRGDDADELLCATLHDNNISAVAITDHFKIDADRISHLRSLASDIVFFPGVELRTDKGADNLHLIIVFSNEIDLSTLSMDFEAIMLRTNAKSNSSPETIYWTFEDIVSFAKSHDGLITIHAGKKTNGIDKEISNALPVKEAIKADIAENIDFFEIGKKTDINDYYKWVFKEVEEKPLIMCSDCHDPRKYTSKENLWIKANLTFEGLKQCRYQPTERVYIGSIPPALDRANKNGKSNIQRISVHKNENPKNVDINWFDFELPLNSGLVAIIGNKGSGKSALSDIIGHLCKCNTMENASFLNETRFRKPPKNFAEDYIATIQWGDSHVESISLSESNYNTTIEDAQYLPQKYIEEVCNDIGNEFQREIDRVIFSYVDRTERGTATNLEELVFNKSKAISLSMQKLNIEINDINDTLIKLEEKKTSQYRIHISDSLKKLKDTLERHENTKPQEIKKPEPKEDKSDYQDKLKTLNSSIENLESKIEEYRNNLTQINIVIDEANQLIAKLDLLESNVKETELLLKDFIKKYTLDVDESGITLVTPKETIQQYILKLSNDKIVFQKSLNGSDTEDGLLAKLEKEKEKKNSLISTTDSEEKQYQKYLSDLDEWEKQRKLIIGTKTTEDTLTYFQNEADYIENELDTIYEGTKSRRDEKIRELYLQKSNLVSVYHEIYAPVEVEIKKLLGELEESIEFAAEIQLEQSDFAETALSLINQKYAGLFKGKSEAYNKMNQLLRRTEFDNVDSVIDFIHDVLVVVDEDLDNSTKKVPDKKALYNLLCCLDYIGVSFKLKMGERDLEELSPGERGIVLLVFYLALSQNNIPIIIDQPEDNLDNQSVYSKLVPCICEAKKKRQVIIVSHNPNIAIACDAEQIVYCHMDKNTHTITYEAGAIENSIVKGHVVDVLEGTMPAFNLRQKKYTQK